MAISIKWNADNYVEGDVANLHILSTNEAGVAIKGPVVLTVAAATGQMLVSDEVHSYDNKYELTVTRNGVVIGSSSLATHREKDLPGPKTIIQGDEQLGYYGSFVGNLGNISDLALKNMAGADCWHKCSYQGDIIYIPAYYSTNTTATSLKLLNEIGAVSYHPDTVTAMRDTAGSRSVAKVANGFKRSIVFNHPNIETGETSFTEGVFGAMPWLFFNLPKDIEFPPFGVPRAPLSSSATATGRHYYTILMPDGMYHVNVTINIDGTVSQAMGTASLSLAGAIRDNTTIRSDYFTPFWYIRVSRDDATITE